MQVEERRACPTCGADNPDEAAFCWQCFAPFMPAPAMPGPGAGTRTPVPAAPNGWGPGGTPAPTSANLPPGGAANAGRNGRIVKVVVGVVVALAVSGFVRNLLSSEYHVPGSIGGMPRINNADTAQFERDMAAEGEKEGLTIEAAVYGASDTPDVLFILVNGKAAENTDELFNSFLDGIATSGVTVERSNATTGSYGDAEFRCLPLAANGVEPVACIWREDASVGMTLDLTPESDAGGALKAAYDATHT